MKKVIDKYQKRCYSKGIRRGKVVCGNKERTLNRKRG